MQPETLRAARVGALLLLFLLALVLGWRRPPARPAIKPRPDHAVVALAVPPAPAPEPALPWQGPPTPGLLPDRLPDRGGHRPAREGGRRHTVRAGETLYAIAHHHGTTVAALMAANGLRATVIQVGQELALPGSGGGGEEPAPPSRHRVQAGETLWELAQFYGVPLAALLQANPGVDPGVLQIDQELALPPGARPGRAPAFRAGDVVRGALFRWPVRGAISSPFGPRWGRWHSGIDLAVDSGTPIHAARAGVVSAAGWLGGYGRTVILRHEDGSATLYAHASELRVLEGEAVDQGQVIALAGSTGNSTGPHLHFEVIIDDRPQDPLGYLPSQQAAGRLP